MWRGVWKRRVRSLPAGRHAAQMLGRSGLLDKVPVVASAAAAINAARARRMP